MPLLILFFLVEPFLIFSVFSNDHNTFITILIIRPFHFMILFFELLIRIRGMLFELFGMLCIIDQNGSYKFQMISLWVYDFFEPKEVMWEVVNSFWPSTSWSKFSFCNCSSSSWNHSLRVYDFFEPMQVFWEVLNSFWLSTSWHKFSFCIWSSSS